MGIKSSSFAVVMGCCVVGHAATWDAGGDGSSYSDPGNWNPAFVPATTDDVIIPLLWEDAGAAVPHADLPRGPSGIRR